MSNIFLQAFQYLLNWPSVNSRLIWLESPIAMLYSRAKVMCISRTWIKKMWYIYHFAITQQLGTINADINYIRRDDKTKQSAWYSTGDSMTRGELYTAIATACNGSKREFVYGNQRIMHQPANSAASANTFSASSSRSRFERHLARRLRARTTFTLYTTG